MGWCGVAGGGKVGDGCRFTRLQVYLIFGLRDQDVSLAFAALSSRIFHSYNLALLHIGIRYLYKPDPSISHVSRLI